MKFLIFSLLSLVTGVPRLLPVANNPTLSSVPEKLRLYQNATGISDDNLLSIFKRSLEGELSKNFIYSSMNFKGGYENTNPKFRYTGTVGSGAIHPVIFTKSTVNVDAVINGGVFLCMKPGFYHFSGLFSN